MANREIHWVSAYNHARVTIYPDVEETGVFKDVPFDLEVTLQPSGALLVEYRNADGIMSKYLSHIIRDKYIDNKMYGGNNTFSLMSDEIKILEEIHDFMRQSGIWDRRYAPGASFTGHDITPEDGLRDFHPQKQGYAVHRYDD